MIHLSKQFLATTQHAFDIALLLYVVIDATRRYTLATKAGVNKVGGYIRERVTTIIRDSIKDEVIPAQAPRHGRAKRSSARCRVIVTRPSVASMYMRKGKR